MSGHYGVSQDELEQPAIRTRDAIVRAALDQLDLLALPSRLPAYQKASPTSKEASRAVAKRAPSQRERVEEAIHSAGAIGATRRELESLTGLLTQSLCGRINECKKLGVVMATVRVRDGGEVLVHREYYGK